MRDEVKSFIKKIIIVAFAVATIASIFSATKKSIQNHEESSKIGIVTTTEQSND